jgi:hypothetical protein
MQDVIARQRPETGERIDMRKGRLVGLPADADARGVVIEVGGDEPDHLVTAKLLASIARPPASATAPPWREMVAAFSRWILSVRVQHDPEAAWRPQLLVPAHFEMSKERAEELVGDGLAAINVALGAAHAQMPALVRGVALAAGEELATLPRRWREARTLTDESERVMRHEAELAELMQEGDQALTARFPSIDSAEAPANFRNRVVRPSRGVLHLAAGLAQVLDDVERQIAAERQPSRATSLRTESGDSPHEPRVSLQDLLLNPEFSVAAINRALRLEAGLQRLDAQRPKPEEVVRLRWKEATGPAPATA